jgi:hypothetical protein
LKDRTSDAIVAANAGRVAFVAGVVPAPEDTAVELFAQGGDVAVCHFGVAVLGSSWSQGK